MLLYNFRLFPWPFWRLPLRLQRFWDWDTDVVWGVLLILLGALLIVSKRRSEEQHRGEGSVGDRWGKELTRCTRDKMIGGVCSGLGQYFSIDPSLIRLVWALGTIVSAFFWGIAIYILLWMVLPEELQQIEPMASPGEEAEQSEGEP